MIIPLQDIDDFDKKLGIEEADNQTVHDIDLNQDSEEGPPDYDYDDVPPSPTVVGVGLKNLPHSHSYDSTCTKSTAEEDPKCRLETAPVTVDDLELKAVNFVYRHVYFDSISATYIIDPNAPDLSSILGGSSCPKPRRKNLFLQSECGSIDVDVRVLDMETKVREQETKVGEQETKLRRKPKKVVLDFRTTFGPITVKLRSSSSQHPIRLSASSKCGPAKVLLPLTFQGFVTLSVTLGELSLSPKIKANVAWDSHSGKTRTIFIGDQSLLKRRLEDGGEPWGGDEVHVDATCGQVNIDYVES